MTKPMHHIDTSVIIESEKTLDGRFCTKYLQKINYNYESKFSLPVLGEIMLSLLLLRDSSKRHAFLDFFYGLKASRKIEIFTPVENSDVIKRIKEIDTRIESTDASIVACAVEDKANNLVTLDKKLIGNRSIEREFGLRISHPKDLI